MIAAITLFIYILGVWVAYFQLKRWSVDRLLSEQEYQTLFMLSTLSWLIYALYGLVWLINKAKEE